MVDQLYYCILVYLVDHRGQSWLDHLDRLPATNLQPATNQLGMTLNFRQGFRIYLCCIGVKTLEYWVLLGFLLPTAHRLSLNIYTLISIMTAAPEPQFAITYSSVVVDASMMMQHLKGYINIPYYSTLFEQWLGYTAHFYEATTEQARELQPRLKAGNGDKTIRLHGQWPKNRYMFSARVSIVLVSSLCVFWDNVYTAVHLQMRNLYVIKLE